jgi:hypothetical protein
MACADLPFFTFYIKRVVEKKGSSWEKKLVMLHELNTIGGGG